jgi:hypothetical protein
MSTYIPAYFIFLITYIFAKNHFQQNTSAYSLLFLALTNKKIKWNPSFKLTT